MTTKTAKRPKSETSRENLQGYILESKKPKADPIALRLYKNLDDVVRPLPDRQELMNTAIREYLIKMGMLQSESQ